MGLCAHILYCLMFEKCYDGVKIMCRMAIESAFRTLLLYIPVSAIFGEVH